MFLHKDLEYWRCGWATKLTNSPRGWLLLVLDDERAILWSSADASSSIFNRQPSPFFCADRRWTNKGEAHTRKPEFKAKAIALLCAEIMAVW